MLDGFREVDRDFLRWMRGEGVWSLCVVWCFLDMGGKVGDVVDVGEVARTASGAKRVSLVKGLEISVFGDRMAGVGCRDLSVRSSTILLRGPLALDWREWVLVRLTMAGLSGLAASRRVTAGRLICESFPVVVTSGGSGVGGPDSPWTAVVGRKREAMITRWLRKEDIWWDGGILLPFSVGPPEKSTPS